VAKNGEALMGVKNSDRNHSAGGANALRQNCLFRLGVALAENHLVNWRAFGEEFAN
jgi:hypothetical protein